jgi:hypothetical protein
MNPKARFQIPRHDIGPLEPWRDSLANNTQLITVLLEREPLARDGAELLESYRDRVALAALIPDQTAERDAAVSLAAGSAHAAALAQAVTEGWIELTQNGTIKRRFPAGTSALTPGLWVNGWALALVARDQNALAALCDARTLDACRPATDRGDLFWPAMFATLAALVFNPLQFPARAAEALASFSSPGTRIVEPGYVEQLLLPLIKLGGLLVSGDERGWNDALASALTQYKAWYDTEARRFDRSGFVAFNLLGLAALAHDRGITSRLESPYLPLDLIAGDFTRHAVAVTYVYPTRSLSHPDEARWFLDLEGFPRSRRTHFVAEVDGRLVARYTVEGAPGIPQARADFALAPAYHEPHQSSPGDYALDLGELVLIADWLAKRASDSSLSQPERRASLSEAVDAIHVAIARLPPDLERAPETSFWTARGQAAYAYEPGRFSRARLMALADAWQGRANEDHEAAHESAAKISAIAAIELIRAQVIPILEAVARDRSGDLVRSLRPREDDYEKVFVGEAINLARQGYEPMWDASLKIAYPSSEQTALLCYVAPAGMLAEENELSWHFPGGYRAIASWLNPHRVWVRWKYVKPGETSGLAYDGLVWIDDHWTWFPKPYRVLKALSRNDSN